MSDCVTTTQAMLTLYTRSRDVTVMKSPCHCLTSRNSVNSGHLLECCSLRGTTLLPAVREDCVHSRMQCSLPDMYPRLSSVVCIAYDVSAHPACEPFHIYLSACCCILPSICIYLSAYLLIYICMYAFIYLPTYLFTRVNVESDSI